MPNPDDVRQWLVERSIAPTADNMRRASDIMYSQNPIAQSGANTQQQRLAASDQISQLYDQLAQRSAPTPAPAGRRTAPGGGGATGRPARTPASGAAPAAGTPAAAATPAAPTDPQAAARASLPPVLQPELEPAMRNPALRAMAGLPPLPPPTAGVPPSVAPAIAATETPAQQGAPPTPPAPPTDDGRPAPAPGPGSDTPLTPQPPATGTGDTQMDTSLALSPQQQAAASDNMPWADVPGGAGSQSRPTQDPNELTPTQAMVLSALGGGALLGGTGYAMMRNPPNVPRGAATVGPAPGGPAAPPFAGPGPTPPPLRPPPIPVAPTPPPISAALPTGATTMAAPPVPPPLPTGAPATPAAAPPPTAGAHGVRGSVGAPPPPMSPPVPITTPTAGEVRGGMSQTPRPPQTFMTPLPPPGAATLSPLQSEMSRQNLSNIPPPRVRGQPPQQSERGRLDRGGPGQVQVPAVPNAEGRAVPRGATGGRGGGGGGGQKPVGARGVLPQPWWMPNNPLS